MRRGDGKRETDQDTFCRLRARHGATACSAYGLGVIVHDSLANEPEIYLEGGDHASLVHMSGTSFRQLLADARHGFFTEPA
jgi:prolyl-tRNA editing enzyme YbaK/EbsC (Cys-tRNA(Pro) deacylase)